MNRGDFILDLDQTLIFAEPAEEYDFQANKEKAKKFVFHDMEGYYVIFERPGLQDFLTYLFDNFNVSIWTAASKDYALYIIKNIILAGNKNRKLNYIMFSYHCDISEKIQKGTKNIKLLRETFKLPGFLEPSTVILDDYDEVYETQKGNCLIAEPFEFSKEGSDNDDFFKRITPTIRKLVEDAKNNQPFQKTIKKMNQKTLKRIS